MINVCKICGKEFEAKQSNYRLCSDECRRINDRKMRDEWYKANKDKQHQRWVEQQRRRAKPVLCKVCGKPVGYHHTSTGQQRRSHYHEECVVNAAIEAMIRGEKFNNNAKGAIVTAINWGYRKRDLVKIAKEKGLIRDKSKPCFVWREKQKYIS